MEAQLSNGRACAPRRAGTGPTYPPPPPHGLSPVLERNIEALQLRRQREEKEATVEEGVAERLPASPAACGPSICTSPP
jgi:hypothetical protein